MTWVSIPSTPGSLAESWRQQPGSKVYATDLTKDTMPAALAKTDRAVLKQRFTAIVKNIQENGMGSWHDLRDLARGLFSA